MKHSFLLFALLFAVSSVTSKDLKEVLKVKSSEEKEPMMSRGGFLAVGFANRLCTPGDKFHRIRYINQSYQSTDTFNYKDDVGAAANLVNLMLTAGINGQYGGVKWDIGFVPFANRNATHTLSVFGIIPINDRFFIEPMAGYSRFRKMKKIGSLTGKTGNIMFENEVFNQVSLRIIQVQHQYMFGLGLNYKLNENTLIRLDVRHHTVFDTRLKMNVRGYKDDNTSSFVESLLFPKKSRNFRAPSEQVEFNDRYGKPVEKIFDLRHLAFTAQIVFKLVQ